ncbi:MAG: phage portal protein [Oenococcus sp.]|uniref:phage portal protein n=1 Tax=Oenococcus sp. TaxID=1979414 RepID=UPI0039EB623F
MTMFNPRAFKNSLSIGDELGVPFDDPEIINFLNPSEYTSAEQALQNSNIFAAVNQISADLASSTMTAKDPQVQMLLDNPSWTSNRQAFWQSMFAQLLLSGDCFAYRWRNRNGKDMRLEYLRPSQVSAFLLTDGTGLIYNLVFDEPDIANLWNVPANDLIHIRLLSQNGGMTGISPLTSLKSELSIQNSSNGLTLSALAKAITPNGILSITHGGLLDWKHKASRSQQFMKQAQDSKNGPIVLDDLETYTPLQITTDVSKLLASTDWTMTQIAKAFGIPDSYLNGQGDQQSSIVQIQGVYANSLNRYARSIASELSNKFKTEIKINVQSGIDPGNLHFAQTVTDIAKTRSMSANQTVFLLKKLHYFPDEVPDELPVPEVAPTLEQSAGGAGGNEAAVQKGDEGNGSKDPNQG